MRTDRDVLKQATGIKSMEVTDMANKKLVRLLVPMSLG
jgi:hypothetical protein